MLSLINKKNKECDKFYNNYISCLYLHSFEGAHTFFECEKQGQEYYKCLQFIKKKKTVSKNIDSLLKKKID